MKLKSALWTLAGMLGVASQAHAAQELSPTAMNAVKGGVPCLSSIHYCICADPHDHCCDAIGPCLPQSVGVWFNQRGWDSYETCKTGGSWSSACSTTITAYCCLEKYWEDKYCTRESIIDPEFLDEQSCSTPTC